MSSPAGPGKPAAAAASLPVFVSNTTVVAHRIKHNNKFYTVHLTYKNGSPTQLSTEDQLNRIKEILDRAWIDTKDLSKVTIEDGKVFKQGKAAKKPSSFDRAPENSAKIQSNTQAIKNIFNEIIRDSGIAPPARAPAAKAAAAKASPKPAAKPAAKAEELEDDDDEPVSAKAPAKAAARPKAPAKPAASAADAAKAAAKPKAAAQDNAKAAAKAPAAKAAAAKAEDGVSSDEVAEEDDYLDLDEEVDASSKPKSHTAKKSAAAKAAPKPAPAAKKPAAEETEEIEPIEPPEAEEEDEDEEVVYGNGLESGYTIRLKDVTDNDDEVSEVDDVDAAEEEEEVEAAEEEEAAEEVDEASPASGDEKEEVKAGRTAYIVPKQIPPKIIDDLNAICKSSYKTSDVAAVGVAKDEYQHIRVFFVSFFISMFNQNKDIEKLFEGLLSNSRLPPPLKTILKKITMDANPKDLDSLLDFIGKNDQALCEFFRALSHDKDGKVKDNVFTNLYSLAHHFAFPVVIPFVNEGKGFQTHDPIPNTLDKTCYIIASNESLFVVVNKPRSPAKAGDEEEEVF